MARAPAHALLLDVGGQSLRATLLDRDGCLLALERRAVDERRPQPGWVEHDPQALLGALREAVADVLDDECGAAREVEVAGLSCQRASIVCWDRRSGAPLSPVISWQDERGAALLQAAELDVDAVQALTGMRPNAFLGASKLAWCWRELPAVRTAARAGRLAWGPLGSFLLHGLLQERPYRCPASLAQRTLLFDPDRHAWDAALCIRFGIDLGLLPAPASDRGAHGTLVAAEQAIPLRLCAGDQNLLPAALKLGADEAVLNLGTGAFLLAGADGHAPRLLRSVLPGESAPSALVQEGTVNGAASAFAWFRRSAADSEQDAPLTASNAVTPHFLDSVGGLGSPLWRTGDAPRFSRTPDSPAEGRAAIADGLLHLVMLNLEAMRAEGLARGRLYAGGGLAAENGLLQRLADLAGVEVRRPRQAELSLAGAAALLGCEATSGSDCDTFAPGPGAALAHERWQAWRRWAAEQLGCEFA